MQFNKWVIGIGVATLFSLLTAAAGLSQTMNWKAFVAVFSTAMITNLGAYLMKHPLDSVEIESVKTTKGNVETTKTTVTPTQT